MVKIGNGLSYVFSEPFLSLLSSSERASLELRSVVAPRRSRTTYYELVGPGGPMLVGVKGLVPNGGWVCDTCGYRTFGYRRTGFDLHSLVAQEDLPSPLPGIFTIGQSPHVELVATSQRWSELVGNKAARGIVSTALGVAPADKVDRNPPLRKLSEPDPELEARRRAYWRTRG
jgi:hypothetical protein